MQRRRETDEGRVHKAQAQAMLWGLRNRGRQLLAQMLIDRPKVLRRDARQTFAQAAVIGPLAGLLEGGLFQQALGQIRMVQQTMQQAGKDLCAWQADLVKWVIASARKRAGGSSLWNVSEEIIPPSTFQKAAELTFDTPTISGICLGCWSQSLSAMFSRKWNSIQPPIQSSFEAAYSKG